LIENDAAAFPVRFLIKQKSSRGHSELTLNRICVGVVMSKPTEEIHRRTHCIMQELTAEFSLSRLRVIRASQKQPWRHEY
jgi:hypothetical protein